MKKSFWWLGMLGLGVIFSGMAWGADYPTKAITMICPYGAGGSIDTLSRGLAPYLGEELGVPVKIENLVGANGVLAFNKAFSAAPDGYNLLTALVPYMQTAEFLSKSSRYKAAEFIPVFAHARDGVVLVGHPEVFHNFGEFAKAANSRTLSIGSTGIGSPTHLGALIVQKMLGAKMTYVPFDGGAQSVTTLAGKHIDGVTTYVTSALPMIRAGKVKPLLLLATERNPLHPDIPVPKEFGYDIQPLYGMFGIFAPPNTPAEKVKILEAAFVRAVKHPKYQEWGKKMTADFIQVNARDFKSEIEKQVKIVDAYKGLLK